MIDSRNENQAGSAGSSDSAMRLIAGAARVEITPNDLAGLNPFGPDFLSVHDPLFVRALVVGNGDTLSAIVTLDLVEVGDTVDIRQRIENELGIPAGRILLAPTHAHNAPRIGLVPLGGKARIPTPESLVFTEKVYDALVAAIAAAKQVLRPARMGFGHEQVDVNICREAYVDGKWTLGYVPDGVSDKTLSIVTFFSENEQVIACVLNYAVHSTVMLGVRQVSADLAGAAMAHVESKLGGNAVALWTSGSLGDQAPKVQLESPSDDLERDLKFASAAVEAQGFMLGATAIRVLQRSAKATSAAVFGETRVIPCPVRRLEVPPGMEQAEVDNVDLTLTCITIGPVAFAGVSGEVTVPVGRLLADASPLSATLVVSNANARIGYLPTDESYDRHTHASEGCPIVQGHAQANIVEGLCEMISSLVLGCQS